MCPDEVDLSGADLSGMNLRFARMNQALLFGADLSGVDATGASFTDIYAPNANFSCHVYWSISRLGHVVLHSFSGRLLKARWIPFRCRALTSLV